jgi:putative iron-regulated protein
MKKNLTFALVGFLALSACKKKNTQPNEDVTPQQIVSSLSDNVNSAIYAELATKATNLETAIHDFVTLPTTEKLENCKILWKAARASWEQSEGFLYGPVATENIDPRIDSWPIDFNAIDIELAGTTDFSVEANMDALDDALKLSLIHI